MTMLTALKRLSIRHWGWLLFKVILGVIWPITLLLLTPISLLGSLGWVVYLIALTTMVGGLTSIVGLIMSAQRGSVAVVGLSVELAGIALFLVGPLAYAACYTVFSITGYGKFAGTQFVPATVYAYGTVAAIINRILIVAPRRRLQGHNSSTEG